MEGRNGDEEGKRDVIENTAVGVFWRGERGGNENMMRGRRGGEMGNR